MQSGIVYSSELKSLVLSENGDILVTNNETPFEIAARLNSQLNSYIHDTLFGNRLISLINKKQANITNQMVKDIIRECLTPMIEQGKISPNLTINSYIGSINIRIQIIVKDISESIVYNNFLTFLV